MTRILLLSCALVLTACEAIEAPPSDDATKVETKAEIVQAEDKPKPPPAPPGFDEAMATLKPLGIVAGSENPADIQVELAGEAFAESYDYVKSKSSYAYIIWHDGAIRHESYFEPHNTDLRPDSASMHKTVAALVTGVAVEKGFIKSVNDTLETYIPEWAGEPRGQITIRNLLEMNSGLEPLSTDGGMASPSMTFWFQGDRARPIMMDMPLKHEPGTVFNYANVNSQILGHVLEQATGQPYDLFLAENIWQLFCLLYTSPSPRDA